MADPPHSTPDLHPPRQKCSAQDTEGWYPSRGGTRKNGPLLHMQDLGDPGEAKGFIYSVIAQKFI